MMTAAGGTARDAFWRVSGPWRDRPTASSWRRVPDRVTSLMPVPGPTSAEIIDAFMARASRVISSELVDDSKAQITQGFSFNVRVLGPGQVQVSYEARNEYLVKGLAADLRPFLPWVDDTVKVTRVIRTVLASLTDEQWKRSLVTLRSQYQEMLSGDTWTHWAIPAQDFQMSVPDIELAKLVLNSQWFHEDMDPRMRSLLASEHQQMGNYQAVWRLLNVTVLIVALLQRFITEADDAGVLHPKTT